jgi:predicted transcriptional regulator
MVKRGKLEIIKDILLTLHNNHDSMRSTPLLRKSNISTERFNEYSKELLEKGLVIIKHTNTEKNFVLTEKGLRFLEKFSAIKNLIEEFGL